MIGDARFHRSSDVQGLANPAEIGKAYNEVQRRAPVLKFLGKGVRHSRQVFSRLPQID